MKYELGGQEVPRDASEAITDLAQNKTLMVEKLTGEAPVKPEIVSGLKTVEEIFEHFQPKVKMSFENAEGAPVQEELSFQHLGNFGKKGITNQSDFLQGLDHQRENYQKFMRSLKSNKLLQKVLSDPDSKAAYLAALNELVSEIEASEA